MSLLNLVQLTDSAFPSGSYAHSAGLEGLYGLGDVDLEDHMRFLLRNGLQRVELPVLRMAYQAHQQKQDLAPLDRLMDVALPARELREGSRSIGRSFLRAAASLKPSAVRAEHHAVVFGALLHEWAINLEAGLSVYAFQALRQQLSVAQRLGRIGQSAMQDLLHRLKCPIGEAIEASYAVSREEVGGFAPWLDFASLAHERQSARLFLS